MKIINRRTEQVQFSRIIAKNESEDVCNIPFEILTVSTEGFIANGFIAPEYTDDKTTDVVCVDGRYFAVGKATNDFKKYWASVTLPAGIDPRPAPREWKVQISKCPISGKEYVWDERVTNYPSTNTIKVREVTD